MTAGRDFLSDDSAPHPTANSGMGAVLNELQSQRALWEDIRRELQKQNADVLAGINVQGSSPIPASDTGTRRLLFEIGGKTVTVYKTQIYSTFSGNLFVSIAGIGSPTDGIPFVSGDLLTLDEPISELYVQTDGSAACSINGPTNSDGGLFVYGFGISDFDRDRRA